MADHASFGLTEAKRGLYPAGGSTARLPRQVPYCKAMEVLLVGETMSAQEALEMGFVNYVLPKEQVLPKAMEIARKIAANGPVAVQQIRKGAKACLSIPDLPSALSVEAEYAAVVFSHPDAIEGPRAFAQKRKPIWGSKL